MRLHSFQAPTMREAMAQVRKAMGDEAIIVSTHRGSRGVNLTAAVDPERMPQAATAPEPQSLTRAELAERIARALTWHGCPTRLTERLSLIALDRPTADPVAALTGALELVVRSAPLTVEARRPIMLVGPSGAGKTVTCAKLAARAVLAGHVPTIITSDTAKAGGVEQLQAFTRLLDRPLIAAESPEAIGAAVRAVAGTGPVFIDTAGVNPFDAEEIAALRRAAAKVDAELVLVMPAGGDAAEAAETAAAFSLVSARRLIATRLDASRRLGSLLAAAEAGGLSFAAATASPAVSHGLHNLPPAMLARLLLRDPDHERPADLLQKANAA